MSYNHDTPDTTGVEYLFKPKSIAVIGASSDKGKPGGLVLINLVNNGYRGKLFAVNPRCGEINGVKCFSSVLDIPGEIDLAIISVPAGKASDVLRECVQKNVKSAIIFTAGYAEVDSEGAAVQKELTDLARENKMRICGPNCNGIINLVENTFSTFVPLRDFIMNLKPVYPQSLGFATQSGTFGILIYVQTLMNGVGFSSYVSCGNEADLEVADFLAYLLDDPSTKIVGGYYEGVKNAKKLRFVAEKAVELKKPMLIMKVGRTGAGSRAAFSHTGSLAGNDQVYESFFKQMGIIRVNQIPELINFVILHRGGRMPNGRNAAILSSSGGYGVVISDECEKLGLSVPELKEKTRRELQDCIPAFASAKNPVDLTADLMKEPEMLGKCLHIILDDDNIDTVLLNSAFMEPHGHIFARDIIEAYNSTSKPIFLLAWTHSSDKYATEQLKKIKEETGMPILHDPYLLVQALSYLTWYKEKTDLLAAAPPYAPYACSSEKAGELIKSCGQLTEYDSKQVLQQYGIPITREGLAVTKEKAVGLARQIGYPVALKAQSPQILHKTEAKCIALNLSDDDEVRAAYDRIMQNARVYKPDAQIEGVLVQEMLAGGVEVIVGSSKDPVFGPVVMFGLGGIFVEALKDVSFRVAPLKRHDAEEMIKEIKGYRVLQGIRGNPPVDFEALVEVILKVSQLITDFETDIKELDINPLVAFERGVKVADALIFKA